LSVTQEIGKHLTEAKRICGHGNWASWLETNFGWTDRTARNLMQVYETFKSETVSDLNLPIASLYLLAAPSTPRGVRLDVIERVKRDEPVSHKEIKALVSIARETALVRDGSGKTTQEPKKALGAINGEIREEKVAQKKIAQAAPEAPLGAKQLAPTKKYGVILSDCERSESRMDRPAENHNPTSWLDEIKARDVPRIAADDCVLFHWASVSLLPQALEVMAAWGFTYKSQFVWVKDIEGPDYWNRNQHEILLVGTKGNIPAPAPDMRLPSVISGPVSAQSEKPEASYELIEQNCPTSTKIELNARRARDGWDHWELEAPSPESCWSNDDVDAFGIPKFLSRTSPPL
jgi:N6-adenosine-specific RNA methylase IME4